MKKIFVVAAAILLTSSNNLHSFQMTQEQSEAVIKIIYQDPWFALPKNRHHRDDLIKKLLQNEGATKEYINDLKKKY